MHAVTSHLHQFSFQDPLAVRTLQPLPPIHIDQSEVVNELAAKILHSFGPSICSEKALASIRQMPDQHYNARAPSYYFVQQEAEAICAIVATLLSATRVPGNYVLSRKVSKLDWKVTLPEGEGSVLLLPKKNLFPDLTGGSKRGRVSLLCRQVNAIWQVERLFTLTPKKTRVPHFVAARAVEHKVYERVGKELFPTCFYDFEIQKTPDAAPVRTCYYESLITLYFFENKGDIRLLQQLALSAAQKIAILHSKGITLKDLKPQNMLVKNGNEVVLCDIDAAEIDKPLRTEIRSYNTLDYLSPELFTEQPCDSKMCDVFAFGCVLLDLGFNLGAPWDFTHPRRMINAATSQAYHDAAERAHAALVASTAPPAEGLVATVVQRVLGKTPPPSIKKVLFWLAQWALHSDPLSRPTMQKIAEFLSGSYSTVDDLPAAKIADFMDLEKRIAAAARARK